MTAPNDFGADALCVGNLMEKHSIEQVDVFLYIYLSLTWSSCSGVSISRTYVLGQSTPLTIAAQWGEP